MPVRADLKREPTYCRLALRRRAGRARLPVRLCKQCNFDTPSLSARIHARQLRRSLRGSPPQSGRPCTRRARAEARMLRTGRPALRRRRDGARSGAGGRGGGCRARRDNLDRECCWHTRARRTEPVRARMCGVRRVERACAEVRRAACSCARLSRALPPPLSLPPPSPSPSPSQSGCGVGGLRWRWV